MGPVRHILTLISALLIALISAAATPASPIPAFPGEVVGDRTVFEPDAAGFKVINKRVDRATAGPAATAQTTALQKQKVLAGWEHPAGYTKYDDGTVVAQDGQTYTPSRRSDGTIQTNTLGHPIFNTRSGGTRAQTTLTKPATSGPTIVVAPNRTGSAVDGIYGNTRPMTDEFPELAGVNPHYVDGAGPGVNTHCVSCVNATVERLTGRNPDAVAGPANGDGTPNDLLPSAPFGFRSPTNPANVTNELVAQGDGAVAVVRIQQAGPVEHVIVGVNRGGTVHYIDPQLGSIVDLQPNLTVIPGYR